MQLQANRRRSSKKKRSSLRRDTVVRPIRSNADLTAALAQAERLWDSKDGTPECDALDVLATLIHAYEAKHFPVDKTDPIYAIKFHLEHTGHTERDLEGVIGSRARVWEVMNKKRPLTLTMIRALNEAFDIPVEFMVG